METLAVLYARVSTADQEERGTIAMQLDYADRWAAANNVRIVDRYVDEDVSGMLTLAQREEGFRLLNEAADLARRGVKLVLIYDWSRFARDPYPLWDGIHYLERRTGLRIRSLTQEADTSTPERVLLLCLQSGVSSYERAKLLERSSNATEMLARQGVWLGGIVPYGYRKVGDRRDARLEVSEEPIPGHLVSEAEIVRQLYRRTVEGRETTVALADWLNALGIPPAYTRDERPLLRGKRRESTQGRWRPGRVRNMLVNTVYRGVHQWGKRSAREVIERPVPALVDEELWRSAQAVLRANWLRSSRNAQHVYLLRGLMRCGLCGLTYGGYYSASNGSHYRYYRCGGVDRHRGQMDVTCPSRALPASIEEWVWADVEGFLRRPGAALDELAARQAPGLRPEFLVGELESVGQALNGKHAERQRILGLYRKGLIDESAVDAQLVQIAAEEGELRRERERLGRLLEQSGEGGADREVAAALLKELAEWLDRGVSREEQRQLIEILVPRIEVVTVSEGGRRQAEVTAFYQFARGPDLVTASRTNARAVRSYETSRTRRTVRGGWREVAAAGKDSRPL